MVGTTVGVEVRRDGPAALRVACMLWLTAVLAGVVESAVQVGLVLAESGPSTGFAVNVAVRAVIYAAVVLVVANLWRGRRWTRPVLAAGLGGVGLFSLLFEPVGWVVAGGSLPALLASADPAFAAVAAIRGVHVIAVVAALVLMFAPSVTAYVRESRGERRPTAATMR